jgi:amidophosphoribosyltransferase
VEEIRKFIGADTLGYLSHNSLLKAVADEGRFCSACFTDRYPTDVAHEERQKELFGKSMVESSNSKS